MRYLLDQGLARSAVEHLRQAGIESVHVGDLGMAAASDAMILEEGLRRNAIVVTLDTDFHSLLALSNATMPSVIRICLGSLPRARAYDVRARVRAAERIRRCFEKPHIARTRQYKKVRRSLAYKV